MVHSLLALALLLVPSLAAACPACVGQQSSFTTTLKLLAVMILLPFPIVFLVIRAIRKASRELEEPPVVPPTTRKPVDQPLAPLVDVRLGTTFPS